MTKKNKIILAVGLTCSMCAIVTTATAIPLLANKNKIVQTTENKPTLMSDLDFENNKPFEFNNKVYLSLNDAYKELIKSIGGIVPKQYIGDFSNENSNGLITKDKSLFNSYDINKMSLVYQDANGRFVDDYDKALKTFINASNIVTQYHDFKGNYFLDEDEAKESIKSFQTMGVACYDIKDENNRSVKINPLNNEDILAFKKIAINSLIKKANNNSFQTPFNFKAIKTNGITFDKNSELDNNLKTEYNLLISNIIEIFCSKLKKIIIDILKNNQNEYFKVQISIKPYRVNDTKDNKWDAKPIYEVDKNEKTHIYDGTKEARSESLYFWKFGGSCGEIRDQDVGGYLNLVSKNLNYNDAIQLMRIYSNRNEFQNYYKIETIKTNSGGFSPKFEIAKAKLSLSKFFDNFNVVDYSITQNNEVTDITSCNVPKARVGKILEQSDTWDYGPALNPNFLNDTILTFGLRPYISPDKIYQFENEVKRQLNNNFLYDVLLETKQKLNSKNNVNQAKKLLDFLLKDKNTFTANINTSNLKIISANNQNLFNVNVLNNLDIDASKYNTKESLCNKTPGAYNRTNNCTANYETNNSELLLAYNCQKYLKEKFYKIVDKSPNNNVDSYLFELSESIADWRIMERYIYNKFKNTITSESDCHNKAYYFDFLGFDSSDISDLDFVSQYFNIDSYDKPNKRTIFYNQTSRYLTHFPHEPFVQKDFNKVIDFDSLIRSSGKVNQIGFNYDIDNYLEDFSYIITYNDAPVFKINNDFLKTINLEYKKELSDLFYGSELRYNPNSTTLYNFRNLTSLANLDTTDKQRNILNDLLENVSKNVKFDQSSSSMSKNEFNINYNYNKSTSFDWNNYFLKNNYIIPYKTLPMPNTSYSNDNKYFNGALDSIALLRKNYFSLYTNDPTSIDNEILQKNKPDDFLMLYNKYGNDTLLPAPLIYTEVLLGSNNFNPSMTNHSFNDTIIFDKSQKEDLKLSFQSIYYPQKVYFIYTGPNLVNPKPIYDSEVSSNPGYIDTPELIIENALRTYWLKPDSNYVSYKENNKTYIYKNHVKVLYKFNLNNQEYLFSSIKKAENSIIQYIKDNSYKVNYEIKK